MQKYFDNVTNRSGDAVVNAQVTVTVTATGSLATIYADNGVTTKSNPMVVDSNGYFEFYAANGRYTLTVTGGALTTRVVQDVLLEDITGTGASLVGFSHSDTNPAGSIGAKAHQVISVKDAPYNAVGDGTTDDTTAIQAAFTAAPAGSCVVFPASSAGYKISNNINVPAGVGIAGPGKVLRTHGLAVSNYAFTLNGSNHVRGLQYDGGALTIVSPGLAQSIKDFHCINDNVEFDGNTFLNSCGSYMDFVNEQFATTDTLTGLIVKGNAFGDYLDHAIYCQGYSTVVTGGVTICDNVFYATAATTTRQAVKIKNITGATVSNNAINLPNGIFITVETGLDFPVVASDTKNVTVSGNSGNCVKFFESVCALDANNTSFMVRNLTMAGNAVTCTSYPVSLGLVPAGGTSFATRAGGVLITGNTFTAPSGINVNGDMVSGGIDNLTITGNTLVVTSALTVLNLWGNISGLVFTRNTCTMSTAYAAGNALWNNDNLVGLSGQTAYIPTVAGVYDISDNTMLGNFGCVVAEQPASAVTGLNMTCVLRGNRNISGNSSKREVIFQSSALASATGLFYLENNLSIGGTTSSNVCAVQALLTGLVKVGSGTSGLLVRPNIANTGVSLYSSSVTPDATNFALQTTGALSILNGTSSTILQIGNSTKFAANASGVSITGAIGTGAAAATLASAGTIAPTGVVHFVSGTTTISTITPPANMATTGCFVILIPTGLWATNTAGNIALASTAVLNKALVLAYDTSAGGKWYPSY